eukprot:IDg15152t1
MALRQPACYVQPKMARSYSKNKDAPASKRSMKENQERQEDLPNCLKGDQGSRAGEQDQSAKKTKTVESAGLNQDPALCAKFESCKRQRNYSSVNVFSVFGMQDRD